MEGFYFNRQNESIKSKPKLTPKNADQLQIHGPAKKNKTREAASVQPLQGRRNRAPPSTLPKHSPS